jgi:hypothetical protein
MGVIAIQGSDHRGCKLAGAVSLASSALLRLVPPFLRIQGQSLI